MGPGNWVSASATPSEDPVVTVHLRAADYRFDEGASGAGVEIVATTASGVRRPSQDFQVSITSLAVSGGATSGSDYEAISEQVSFESDDFVASDMACGSRENGADHDSRRWRLRE